jgi:hypothetical protein
MIRRAHFALAVLLLGMNLHSQQPASVQEQPPVQRPVPSAANEIQPTDLSHDYEMREWLVKGAKAADHLSGLGVERTLAEEWTESAETGSRVYPDFKSLRGSPRRRAAVLFLPCTPSMQTAYLYLLAPDDHAWKVSDKLELDCHYDDNVSYELGSIRNPAKDEIQIHHACGGHGTGYLEQNFSVFAPIQGKLKEELETDEVLHSFPAAVSVRHDLDQKSTFSVIPVSNSNSRAIEETRSSTLNDHLTVQRRIFRWDPKEARYIPSAFTPVLAVPAS